MYSPTFVNKLLFLKPEMLSQKVVRFIQAEFLSDPQFKSRAVQKVSAAAGAMCAWVHAVVASSPYYQKNQNSQFTQSAVAGQGSLGVKRTTLDLTVTSAFKGQKRHSRPASRNSAKGGRLLSSKSSSTIQTPLSNSRATHMLPSRIFE